VRDRNGTNGTPRAGARAYVLGGNAETLAYVASLKPENKQITTYMLSLAWTPVGVVVGDTKQRANIAADNVAGWVDQTFPPEDETSFVTSLRDLELLQRSAWGGEPPDRLTESELLNPEDLPEDVLEAIDQPHMALVPCAICRRTCVRDHFVWNERQLCAWDYHTAVFGKRGPWRGVPYEERLFETLPRTPYIASALLDEVAVDVVLAVSGLPEPALQRLVNVAIEEGGEASYLAVRAAEGLTLLRERAAPRRPAEQT
jgi:hypothetical protein